MGTMHHHLAIIQEPTPSIPSPFADIFFFRERSPFADRQAASGDMRGKPDMEEEEASNSRVTSESEREISGHHRGIINE